jgi:membrane-associated protease RseP (regulator of RpoE activity)
MTRALALIAFAAIACAAVAPAQAREGRADEAERLKRLVDRRLDELRAELHAAIDAALGGRAGLPGVDLVPASDEFRELHRLPPRCGLRVVRVEAGGPAGRMGLVPGDVIVAAGARPVESEADVTAAIVRGGGTEVALVIRKGERVATGTPSAAAALQTRTPPPENADQMLERLWNRAVENVLPGGVGEVPTGSGGPESMPAKENPIPEKPGRR